MPPLTAGRRGVQIGRIGSVVGKLGVGLVPGASGSTRKVVQVESRRDFESELGSIPVAAIVEAGTARPRLLRGCLLNIFLQGVPRISLLVFLLVSAAIDGQNDFKFRSLWD